MCGAKQSKRVNLTQKVVFLASKHDYPQNEALTERINGFQCADMVLHASYGQNRCLREKNKKFLEKTAFLGYLHFCNFSVFFLRSKSSHISAHKHAPGGWSVSFGASDIRDQGHVGEKI
jgi:hypothetical protein